jgi:surfeit locus 1 family protein
LTAPLRRARRAALALAALLVCAGFIALGSWQIARRAWKLDLIARVEQRVRAPAVAPPGPGHWSQVSAASHEYRHVQVSGRFLDSAQTLVQASTELGAGFWVLTPLRLADGSVLLINRGFVPPELRDHVAPAAAPAWANPATTTVTGLLRLSEPGGAFLRHNDAAANRWYSRDVAAIGAARGLGVVAPYFIDADAAPGVGSIAAGAVAPIGGLTVIAFHNNHLVYAITWYTLALMTAGAAWRVMREEQGAEHD